MQTVYLFVNLDQVNETLKVCKFIDSNLTEINKRYIIEFIRLHKKDLKNRKTVEELKQSGITHLPTLMTQNSLVIGVQRISEFFTTKPQANFATQKYKYNSSSSMNDPTDIMDKFYERMSDRNLSFDEEDDDRMVSSYKGVSTEDLRDPKLSKLISQFTKQPQGARRNPVTDVHAEVQKFMPRTADDMAAQIGKGIPYKRRHEGPDKGGIAERETPSGSTAKLGEDGYMTRPVDRKSAGHINNVLKKMSEYQKSGNRRVAGITGDGELDEGELTETILKNARQMRD